MLTRQDSTLPRRSCRAAVIAGKIDYPRWPLDDSADPVDVQRADGPTGRCGNNRLAPGWGIR